MQKKVRLQKTQSQCTKYTVTQGEEKVMLDSKDDQAPRTCTCTCLAV